MWDGLAALMMTLAGLGSTWLVQATVLLALGLLAGQMLRRSGPAVSSGIYRTTLAAILICPVASAVLIGAGVDGLALRWPGPVHEPATAPRPPAVSRPVVVAREPDRRDVLLDRGDRPLERAPRAREEEATSIAAKPMPPAPTRRPSPRLTLAAAAAVGFAVWGMGATVIGLRLWVGLIRMRRLRGSAVPAEPDAAALCRDVARRMNVGAPTVWRSPFLFSPCLDGLRRPAILLPDDVDGNLMDIFVHELAHLVRRDGFWNLLRRSAGVVFWVHPLFWVLTRRLEAAAEEVCDDYVVQFGADRARYAGHLLELAGRALPPVAPAGVGMISLRSMLARRIVRILDTSRTLSTRAGTRAVLVMLSVGLVGTVFAGLLGVGGGDRKARAQGPTKATAASLPPKTETIRGRVVGPNGQPIPGATVVASRSRLVLNGIGDEYRTVKRYRRVSRITDQDGRFEIDISGPETDPDRLEDWGDVQVLATAPGFGFGFLSNGEPIRLTADDLPINGRLVDLEGRPAPGVHVELGQVWVPAPGIAEGTVSRSKPWSMAGRLGLDLAPLLPEGVVTDADGRFRIEGLGRDALTSLTLSGPSVAYKRAKVVTRVMEPVEDKPRDAAFAHLDDPVTYGADCTITVAPTRPIEGFVRDAETKEPIRGAVVTAAALSNMNMTIDGLITAETDAQGYYRLIGLPKETGKGHELAVYPPLDQPYFITSDIEVPARPGLDTVHRDIALRRGTWVTGKVTDLKTGEPVNAVVDYFPFLTNEHAKDYPNFDPGITGSVGTKTRYRTDRAGRFRTVALPGRGVVTARVERGPYRTGFGAEMIAKGARKEQLLTYDHIYPSLYQGLREVEVPEGAASFSCDLPLDPGDTRRLRLVDPSGMPVTDVRVIGRLPDASDYDHSPRAENVITIRGLEPGKARTVVIRHAARKLGAILTVPAEGSEDGDEVTVTLRPDAAVTARFVDDRGKPFAGYVQIRLVPSVVSLHDEINITDLPLDADGRFRYEELPSGGPYRLWVIKKHGSYARAKRKGDEFTPFELSSDLKVEPGQVVDFGTYDVTTGKPIDPPPTKPTHADVPINGRIVDLEGRPVAGVSVKTGSYQIPKSGDLTSWLEGVKKGEPPWIVRKHVDWNPESSPTAMREATTNADGRFRLEGLGAERVVELTLQGGTMAATKIVVATRKMDPIPARGFGNQYGPGFLSIYGADFTFTAAPARALEGVVKDAKTGQPLVGVEVRSYRFAGSDWVGTMTLRTKTDTHGGFRLSGMPKGKGNQLIVVPNDEQPYLVQRVDVADIRGVAPVSVEVALPRGIWIEGTVAEQATAKPVPGAWLHYMPFLENTFAQAHPAFDKYGNSENSDIQDRYKTRADGTFRLVGLPGRAIVGAIVNDKSYLQGVGSDAIAGLNKSGHFETYRSPINPGRLWPTVMKEINPPADEEVVHLDLLVATGPSIRLTVVDADGKPVIGVSTRGLEGRSSYEREAMTSSEGQVANLMPGEERTVLLLHEGRKIGKVVRVREGDDVNGPIVARLEPLATMTGRVADADGNPVSGATVRPDLLPSGDFPLSLPHVATDEQGRFLIPGVPVGCDYSMAVETSGALRARQFAFLKRATVRPGETTDVGEIRFKSD